MTAVLQADDVTKHFPGRRGLFGGHRGVVRAVDGISFAIEGGKTLGVVGELGCGKTTTAKLVLGLEEPSGGTILFEGRALGGLDAAGRRHYRKSVQAVFQDPYASLNPRMRISAIIAEPLITNETVAPDAVRTRMLEMLDLVGLPARSADLFPHEFSGGQRQRIAIARALVLSPKLVVLDEPVSALDVSIRAQILNLLRELQDRLGLSYLFIAHDLAAVAHMSHEIVVMYLGKIVETRRGAGARPRAAASLHQGAVLGRPAEPSRRAARGRGAGRARCRARSIRRAAATSIRAARTPCRAARARAPPLRQVEDRIVACHLYTAREGRHDIVPGLRGSARGSSRFGAIGCHGRRRRRRRAA